AVVGGVERLFSVLAAGSGFVIAAQQENEVVGPRGDGQHGDHADGVGGEADDVQIAGGSDDALCGIELEPDQNQTNDRGPQRAVDDEQHHKDDTDRDRRHEVHAVVGGEKGVGVEHGVAGHIGFDARRRRYALDNLADLGDRLVAGGGALSTVEEDLHIGGLTVRALGAGGGQRITPEILNVLD